MSGLNFSRSDNSGWDKDVLDIAGEGTDTGINTAATVRSFEIGPARLTHRLPDDLDHLLECLLRRDWID